MVPHEMLAALMTAVRAINKEANETSTRAQSGGSKEGSNAKDDDESDLSPTGSLLTAEDVLPIMVFTAIQAGLTDPFLALRFAEEYGTRAQSGGGGGEAAYYLCMLESAVVFVCSSMDEQESGVRESGALFSSSSTTSEEIDVDEDEDETSPLVPNDAGKVLEHGMKEADEDERAAEIHDAPLPPPPVAGSGELGIGVVPEESPAGPSSLGGNEGAA